MFIRNTSIQTKILLLAGGSAVLALVIACAGLAWHTVDSLRDAKGNQLRNQAEFVASQAGPVLALRDADRAQKLLASFGTDSTVEEARLYGNDRQLLATWGEQESLSAPVSTPQGYRYIGLAQVEVVHQVVVGSQPLGTVYVRANTSDLMERLVAFAWCAGYVVALAMSVVLLVAMRLRRAISRPIMDLAKAAERISNNADSTIRIHTNAQAELKGLQDAFNHMLTRIQASEADVRKAHLGLEDGVIARTKELSRELRRHQEAEAELKSAREAAEAANRAKTELLTKLSHEIREPLSGIMRLTEALLNESSDSSAEDRQKCLTTIQRHGAHLFELINDIATELPESGTGTELAALESSRHSPSAATAALADGTETVPATLESSRHSPSVVTAALADGTGTVPATLESSRHSPSAVTGGCLTGSRILVVDDGESNRQLIQKMLRDAGAEVITANDGLEAIHATGRNQPELILMDLRMPVMDGCSATRELRSNGYTRPIIAMLSEAIRDGEEKCLQAGCTCYIAKPIEPTQLLEMVTQQLNAETEPVPA